MVRHSSDSSRAVQRLRTEARILGEARRLFAENGYDSTTIRAVASAAGVDPALVMRYYGSKERLFQEAAKVDPEDVRAGTAQEVADLMLASLHEKLEAEPVAMLAMLRSMLTHHDATENVRKFIAGPQEQLSRCLAADDPLLRTGLIGSVMLGVVVARHLLELDGVRDAPPDRIVELVTPAVYALAGLTDPPADGPEADRQVVEKG